MIFHLKFGMFIKSIILKGNIIVILAGWPWFDAGAGIMLPKEMHGKSNSVHF